MSAISKLATVYEMKPSTSFHPTVVILDDQSTGRLILAEIIKGINSNIHIAMFANPLEAIDYVRAMPVDLVLTDYKMPVMNGIETIRQLRTMYNYQELPIVMTTVVDDREIRHRAFEVGATDFLIRPIDAIECRARCQNLLNLRQQYLVNNNHAHELEERVMEVTRELRLREVDTLFRLARAADRRDAVTGTHLKRMAKYSALIARHLGMSEGEVETIELAAPMHDIGKICIPDAIMKKPGKLTDDETAIMQTHAQIGYDILTDSPSRFLQAAATIALNHHEKYDGSGYPRRLKGTDIPLMARIVSLADVFDALTSARPYKAAWGWNIALDFIRGQKGKHFDPELVDIFVSNQEEAQVIQHSFMDTAHAFTPS